MTMSTTKKTASTPDKKSENKADDHTIPTINEGADAEDVIHIHPNVVANIVRLAALGVEGVHSIGGSFVGNLAGILKWRESDNGIAIDSNEADEYVIKIRLYMLLGAELTSVGRDVQTAIREQVGRMTEKKVAKVDVVIEGIRTGEPEKEDPDTWED